MGEQARAKVREFVSRHTDGVPVADDEDLFDSGYANSLFAVQLVMWIERTFDLTVERTDLVRANFRSVDAIVSFLDSRAFLHGKDAAWTSS
jgi:methoxymalonate biosynthesis acyl carrier protein